MTPDRGSQRITHRTASGEADFWLVRRFLLDAWALAPLGHVWDVRRWDGAYYHNAQPGWRAHWRGGAAVGLWEASGAAGAGARLVGAVHPEGAGEAWLHVHPACRWLEAEMLEWAEANLANPGADGSPRVSVFASDGDRERQELLGRRGYEKTAGGEHLRRWCGACPPEGAPLPAGYRLHAVRPGHAEDCERYAALINAAFRRTCHTAQEVATFTMLSPSFSPELELVAVAPDGSFAALTGMIYDTGNRFGLFEPVCATPAPRPLGLTGGLMREGVRRVLALGAEQCYVSTGIGMAANRFYEAVGFKPVATGHYWVKNV
jgi:predicted N-acetyltransferase YhbS